jgi:hypothetical protein
MSEFMLDYNNAINHTTKGEMTMKKMIKMAAAVITLVGAFSGMAFATPSTQIWIPSTDIQAFKTLHLNFDTYIRSTGVGSFGNPDVRDPNVIMMGPTVGILPFEKIQAEVGFDFLVVGNDAYDNYPFMGHFKVGTPEDSLFTYSPALAVGMYNIGNSHKPNMTSGMNIAYGLAARTLPIVGRLSAGGYTGSETALVGPTNFLGQSNSQNAGVLLSWDRTMTEISDKLWLAVDYMGGNNAMGAVSFGASWAFSKNVSVIGGYTIYNQRSLAGSDTLTFQVDINFP